MIIIFEFIFVYKEVKLSPIINKQTIQNHSKHQGTKKIIKNSEPETKQ